MRESERCVGVSLHAYACLCPHVCVPSSVKQGVFPAACVLSAVFYQGSPGCLWSILRSRLIYNTSSLCARRPAHPQVSGQSTRSPLRVLGPSVFAERDILPKAGA